MSLSPIDWNETPLNELLETKTNNRKGDERSATELEDRNKDLFFKQVEETKNTIDPDDKSIDETASSAKEITEKNKNNYCSENSSVFADKDNDEAREDSADFEVSGSKQTPNQQVGNKEPIPRQQESDEPMTSIDDTKEKAVAIPVEAESTTATENPAAASTSAGPLVSPILVTPKDEALVADQAPVIKEQPSPYHLYQQMLALEEQELVLNIEVFTCGVCLVECGTEEGAVLRECLHAYCRGCLIELIRRCDDEVTCPYRDEAYSCGAALRESEVRAMVSAADYEARLKRTLQLAGARMKDAFHCRTPNCAGWCVHDGQTEAFPCPLCNKNNCLRCEAIHEGKTCVQYANEKQNLTTEDVANRMDTEISMNCPTCKVVVMKIDGCDWVMCSICKTEICWVRRMARWGPGGRGDHSGGCQCRRFRGMLCHPACRNCH